MLPQPHFDAYSTRYCSGREDYFYWRKKTRNGRHMYVDLSTFPYSHFVQRLAEGLSKRCAFCLIFKPTCPCTSLVPMPCTCSQASFPVSLLAHKPRSQSLYFPTSLIPRLSTSPLASFPGSLSKRKGESLGTRLQ